MRTSTFRLPAEKPRACAAELADAKWHLRSLTASEQIDAEACVRGGAMGSFALLAASRGLDSIEVSVRQDDGTVITKSMAIPAGRDQRARWLDEALADDPAALGEIAAEVMRLSTLSAEGKGSAGSPPTS
mgnify:CR=1 FL=1